MWSHPHPHGSQDACIVLGNTVPWISPEGPQTGIAKVLCAELCSLHSYVEALTPRTSKSDRLW